MTKPKIQVVGPSSGTEITLAWDMTSTFWDSGIFWDATTFQASKLIPMINLVEQTPKIGLGQNRVVIGVV